MSLRRFSLAAAVLLSLSSAAVPVSADSALIDDFSTFPYLWKATHRVVLDNPDTPMSRARVRRAVAASERVLSVKAPLHVPVEISTQNCTPGPGAVNAVLLGSESLDARDADPTTITLGGIPASSYRLAARGTRSSRRAARGSADLELVFRGTRACAAAASVDPALEGRTTDGRWFEGGGAGALVARPYVGSVDWSTADGLRFMYYGHNTGDALALELRDNRAPDPGPGGWQLVWREEFNARAGHPVNSARWSHETGDGTAQGIPGWGNNEREYYTDSLANASHDGQGNLLISVRPADQPLSCYYGPCEYTSARLVSRDRVEIGHGRIEARIKVPAGAGLWPAFWALGSDIGEVGWPTCGEIDVMEYLGRNPNDVFGTLHGPGYSGANGISGQTTLPGPLSDDFHVFAIEWQSDRVDWFVDGALYHSATRADVGGNPWVFDKPFFMILNVAVGGFLGGAVDPGLTFPRSMAIDYIRVYAAPDTAERFEAPFRDDFTGWREISLPFSDFVRSARQPAGAPNDGLNLDEVWGYGFRVPGHGLDAPPFFFDQVRLIRPTSVIVTNALDQGPGSLRNAVAAVADGGMVTFDPGLAGAAITLASGPIRISSKAVTIDATATPGITLLGTGSDRLLIVDADARATVRGLTFANGYGWQLAGAILVNGRLALDHVVVRNSTVAATAGDWWMGGGGIYVGGGATLDLADSTVRDNTTYNGIDGGGIYVFQNGTLHVARSTISGNVAANVGGGLRMLGSGTIENSTFSGNATGAWHGSALFVTDGVLGVQSSTITANAAPAGSAAVFVGTFTAASATLSLADTILGGNSDFGCFVAPFGAGSVTLSSGGHNVVTDATCNSVPSDQIVGDVGVAALAANGGPTATHALLPGSPAVDNADAARCPATDQRGMARPEGAGCDVGAFELTP
jgi:beta-glucanase (GH16 family)